MQMFCANPDWMNEILINDERLGDANELYRLMYMIRQVQRKIESVYHLDEMKTPVHLCIGQEAIAAGVCHALSSSDYVFSNHRGHGHYLAKGGNLKKMIAELYCRTGGCALGRGGSMHLVDTAVGLMGASSIVAGGIPLSVGAALTSTLHSDQRISVAFFGDGAADEGVLYESINFAVLKKLPVLFICENNFYAVCSPISNRQICETSIATRFSSMGLPSLRIDGTNVQQVYEIAADAAKRAREGGGPTFIEAVAYRWCGHSGAGADTKLAYRSQAELDSWMDICPLKRMKRALLVHSSNVDVVAKIEVCIDREIEEAFAHAFDTPLPGAEDVCATKCLYEGA